MSINQPVTIMSDLAPFVAATIHDKVVLDLLEENKKLKEYLGVYHKVEFTGPYGSPVYARADFGRDGTYHDNANLWEVTIPPQQQQSDVQVCRLKNLLNVEIRIGGLVNTSFVKDHFVACIDEENENALTIIFTDPTVWLTLKVTGYNHDRMTYMLEQIDADQEDSSFQSMERASEECPDAIVTFCRFTPTVDAMRDIISTLPQAHDKELQRRVQEYHLDQSIIQKVSTFLEDNWNQDEPRREPVLESIIAIVYRTGYLNDPSSLTEILRALMIASHEYLIEIRDKLATEGISW